MSIRNGKSRKQLSLTWRDLQDVLDGRPSSFYKVKKFVSYDDDGGNILNAYLKKTERQLKRLPDSEFGDLMSEADKQIWRCCGWFMRYKKAGKPSKIRFKVYYYQRLKQCFIDRVRATQKPADLVNTTAASLSQLYDDVGFDPPVNGPIAKSDVVARIDIQNRVDELGRTEQIIVSKLDNGWTVSQIKKELVRKMMLRRHIRDYDKVTKVVKRKINQSLAVIRSSMEDVKEAFNEDM